MIEHFIKTATCRVSCGSESGTGWVIKENLVVTARHCVLASLEEGQATELFFRSSGDIPFPATIVAQSEEWDICLLSFDNQMEIQPLSISFELPREGEFWQTFGYPQNKLLLGHRLTGNVAQVLDVPISKMDLDLSLELTDSLQNYQGLSGAAIVCRGCVVGMIRLKVDGTIGALSLHQVKEFMSRNGVITESIESTAIPYTPLLAKRSRFFESFIQAVQSRTGRYLFLEGAHGYGKSTFCRNFQVNDSKIVNLGCYCLSDPNSSLGPDYRAQSQVFLDWLTTTISELITAKPPRKEKRSDAEEISITSQYIDAFSQYCARKKSCGVLFIDGLNEIPTDFLLIKLLGLLPVTVPPNITIILTAPNFAIMAGMLAGKVKTNDVFQLPPLSKSACYSYCQCALKSERITCGVIDRICEKAQGHPLYLRYLVEYVNHQSADYDLDDFPILTGPIEDYYQGIWAKLILDSDAVNALAIMARLRCGIPLSDFSKILNHSEQAQFISVINRIHHLLSDKDSTSVYHSSFSEFIIEETKAISEICYRRLADFCDKETNIQYCVFNRVFHLLRADKSEVFAVCNQDWVNNAVILGIEPDILISDVDDVVKYAAEKASAEEFFRLMLLSQRISFRYDTLFAQSARLIAEALIVLGRPDEALQHVLRLNTLIVDPEDALQISFLLHHHGYDDASLTLLERVIKRIVGSYDTPMHLIDFLNICSWHIQSIFLIKLAGGWDGVEQFMSVMDMAQQACDEGLKENRSLRDMLLNQLLARSTNYFISFRDEYSDFNNIREIQKNNNLFQTGFSSLYLHSLCIALLNFAHTVDTYHLSKKRKSLDKCFSDITELISTSKIDSSLTDDIADMLVRFGGPVNLVKLFNARGSRQDPQPLQITGKNGVDINHAGLLKSLCCWRVAAFLDSNFHGVYSSIISTNDWFGFIEHIIGGLYCCDGKARRSMVDANKSSIVICYEQLKTKVIEPLRFTLQQRADWKTCYAIPEKSLPEVYRQLAELLRDCFPEKLPEWLDDLTERMDGQWGMYSEGFRASVYFLLKELTREKPNETLALKLLSILCFWRDHVLCGVENRHELVPEILRMIPIFSFLGAKEEAERLYQRLLSVSMGPSWYKEDQLGIMNEALNSVAISEKAAQRLPHVAGYLERASGEMTFQRYVRAEKSILLGQIARQGKIKASLAYFRRQCCGSIEELWNESQQGFIDKVGPFRGSRFPGGALDEQDAILSIVQNLGTIPWPLRWALLEIFYCGDSRHLTDYAEFFSKIVNEVGADPELIRRVEIIAKAETSVNDHSDFASAFQRKLNPELHEFFATIFDSLSLIKSSDLPMQQTSRDIDDNDADERFFLPGAFGRQKELRDAEKILIKAEKELSLSNHKEAKIQAVKVLLTAQRGGWNIWGNLSESTQRAKKILTQEESCASDVIHYYAPLIENEHHVARWISVEFLIQEIGSLFTAEESSGVLDSVIDHIRLIVGDATKEIQSFDFLAENILEPNSNIEIFKFIVWLCDHPKWLRRNRASAMLLWLIEQMPEFLHEAVKIAFSMREGYGPEVLCGVLDGASVRQPEMIWDNIVSVLDLTRVTQELHHVSRMVVLERLASRAKKTGSLSAQFAIDLIKKSFIGKFKTGDPPKLPIWANNLGWEWGQLSSLMALESVVDWEKELQKLCFPLNITDTLTLENAVSSSFQEGKNVPLNRWTSKLYYALNMALWKHVSFDQACIIETILRVYNPSQPERTVQGMENSYTDQLISAIETGDYSVVLGSNETVVLNYHDLAVNASEDGVHHIEILCLLAPASNQWGPFRPQLEQSFWSSELPRESTVKMPFETCCRLKIKCVFFDSFTPATPLLFFQNLVGAEEKDFIRQNWRYGRRNSIRGFGRPERSGCSLSISRKVLNIPSGFKLAWIIWFNGKIEAFVDEYNNRF